MHCQRHVSQTPNGRGEFPRLLLAALFRRRHSGLVRDEFLPCCRVMKRDLPAGARMF